MAQQEQKALEEQKAYVIIWFFNICFLKKIKSEKERLEREALTREKAEREKAALREIDQRIAARVRSSTVEREAIASKAEEVNYEKEKKNWFLFRLVCWLPMKLEKMNNEWKKKIVCVKNV